MNHQSINVTLSDKQFLSIIAALFAQMNRSPLFVEECTDVCYRLLSSFLHSKFNKE